MVCPLSLLGLPVDFIMDYTNEQIQTLLCFCGFVFCLGGFVVIFWFCFVLFVVFFLNKT